MLTAAAAARCSGLAWLGPVLTSGRCFLVQLPAVHPLRQLFEKRVKKKIKGQDTRAIELFIEQPKSFQESKFLRAVSSSRGQDECVQKARRGMGEEGTAAVEMAPEDGGGGLFGSRALQLYFARSSRHSASRLAAHNRKSSKGSGVVAKREAPQTQRGGARKGASSASGVKSMGAAKPEIGKPARPKGVDKGKSSPADRPGVSVSNSKGAGVVKKKKFKKVSAEV